MARIGFYFALLVLLAAPALGKGGFRDAEQKARQERAANRDAAGKLQTCLQAAADEDAKKACRDSAAQALETASGKTMSNAEKKAALQRAAGAEAAAVLQECLKSAGDAAASKGADGAAGSACGARGDPPRALSTVIVEGRDGGGGGGGGK